MKSTKSSGHENREAPWAQPQPTVGQDPWNRSPEARRHPELYSTAHGTSGSQMEDDSVPIMPTTSAGNANTAKEGGGPKEHVPGSKDAVHCERESSGLTFGHTVHKHASRRRSSILRDLSLI
ncbi:hypothetical protein NQZ79_g6102 [Umbelopsis isabellina]|nr:hypothetical protein NQZ79_g6102 [Umbelopsis isabellina]